jgi:hypothetical protein
LTLSTVTERARFQAPARTPQALAWDRTHKVFWLGSRDLRRIYLIDPTNWSVLEEKEAPGTPWAAVAINGELRFTIGEALDDDRYIYRYSPETGFTRLFACPEFTGSYLSFDGEHLHLSQWYKQRILKFDENGNIIREVDIGAEICGHTFADGMIYILRGKERPNEEWRIGRLDPRNEKRAIEDLAVVPFAARSLTFDGELFWSNYRAQDTTIGFTLPL